MNSIDDAAIWQERSKKEPAPPKERQARIDQEPGVIILIAVIFRT
jgi:hypothetical protein